MSTSTVKKLAKKPVPAVENLLDRATVESAVRALFAHKKRSEGDALDLSTEMLTLQLGLKKSPTEPSPKQRAVALPHPIYGEASACLFVKDADKPWIRALVTEGVAPGSKEAQVALDGTRAAKRARRADPVRSAGAGAAGDKTQVEKVISLAKLRTSYARFQARRELRDSYDLFFADERILPMLGKALGSTFFTKKKQPISLNCTRPESLPGQISAALKSATVVLRSGTCVSVALAHTDMDLDAVVDNVLAGCNDLIKSHIPKKWSNVQSVSLKLPQSTSLPIYSSLPQAADAEALAKFALAQKNVQAAKDAAKAKKADEAASKKSKKAADDDDDEDWPEIAAGDAPAANKRAKTADAEPKNPRKRVVPPKDDAAPAEPAAAAAEPAAAAKKRKVQPKKATAAKAAEPLETASASSAKKAKKSPAKSPVSASKSVDASPKRPPAAKGKSPAKSPASASKKQKTAKA
mmetsp:Transcript_19749/g.67821  ORF Transcript_19749/g.67821 Transcript_19749/m.67821 type:complete len:466 (+) Transcript_19749:42-1439(+)